jgi:signal transduction histidine kinase
MSLKTGDIGIFIIITTLLILLLIGFIILILFLYKRHQFNAFKRLQTLKNDYEKSLLSAQVEMQEQTLRNISREIHDNIGLALSVAKLHLNTIKWTDTEAAAGKVNDSVGQLSKAIDDLRHLSKTLNYEYIAENGFLGALELEIEQIRKLELYTVHYELSGTPAVIPTQRQVVIFRMIQEALNNSIKHSNASDLWVRVQYLPAYLQVEICDNGKGWKDKANGSAEQPGNGMGIKNMQERARHLNGTCSVSSNHLDKTTVLLTIPFKA